MALDPTTPRSRRAILAAAAGAAAGTVAAAVAKPSRVAAVNGAPGDTIHVGDTYSGVSVQTTLGNAANDEVVLWIASNVDSGHGGGTALVGYSDHGVGVRGENHGAGPGVQAISVSGSAVDASSGIGPGVSASSSSSYGVNASSSSNYGVNATSSTSHAVHAHSTTNIAVWATGGNYGVYSLGVTGIYAQGGAGPALDAWNSATDQATIKGISGGDSTGVLGSSSQALQPPARPKTGVYGYADLDSSARGVMGESTSGHGVHGVATTGYAGYFHGKVFTDKFHEMAETATPAAPNANKARLFVRDNGSGKSQLCVRFNTGGALVIKTQP